MQPHYGNHHALGDGGRPHIPHNTTYHHYSGNPYHGRPSYSIHDFYEHMPPSYYESERYKYAKSRHADDTLFKMYMGGMGVVGLYLFFRILQQSAAK